MTNTPIVPDDPKREVVTNQGYLDGLHKKIKDAEEARRLERNTLSDVMKELGISMSTLRSDIPKEAAKRHQRIEDLKKEKRAVLEPLLEDLEDRYDGAPDSETKWMAGHITAIRKALGK